MRGFWAVAMVPSATSRAMDPQTMLAFVGMQVGRLVVVWLAVDARNVDGLLRLPS